MKNEIGIEVCCYNCHANRYCCNVQSEHEETRLYYGCFNISKDRLVKRIKELQEQLETFENAYHKSLDAYHNVAEQLEELKARRNNEQ